METQREDTTGETQREIFVFMFSKYQAPFRKGKLRTDQLFSRCPPALAKAPVFQPPKCLVKSRPSSQTPSSPSHSHRMIQNRLKLTKPYTSVPLPLGQSVMFPWWTIVWRKQLLAIEWHMWDEKSLVKTWHLATTHQPNQDVSNHVQREKRY